MIGGSREVDRALREWQQEGLPWQLHPGDVGWFRRFGPEAVDAALRTWSENGRIVAAGLLDGPDVLRLAIAPDAQQDATLARRIVEDVPDVDVEAPAGAAIRELLPEEGEAWTPLHRDLSEPVEDPGVRIEAIGPEQAPLRVAVHRASFERSTFTEERWRVMAAGPAYADARCLLAFDEQGEAVAAATVWSAGEGKPGLLEPLGAHHAHRGLGHGRAIAIAAAAALRELGASSAVVCTPSANVAGVAAYRSAGFEARPEVRDLRPAR